MKNIIIIYFLIVASITAQENKNNFNLILRSGIGANKLLVDNKSLNPAISTNSKIGLNLSVGTLIEYKKYALIQFSTGIEFKLNILRTNVSGITTNETFINGWDPIEITDNYMLSYLSIPFLINFRINRKYYLGTGISYDYLLNTKITKSVINSTDPVFERLSNTINPANHSFLIYLKYIFNDNLAISPTILLSPNKTNSQLFSNSTGPSMSFHFDLQLKI